MIVCGSGHSLKVLFNLFVLLLFFKKEIKIKEEKKKRKALRAEKRARKEASGKSGKIKRQNTKQIMAVKKKKFDAVTGQVIQDEAKNEFVDVKDLQLSDNNVATTTNASRNSKRMSNKPKVQAYVPKSNVSSPNSSGSLNKPPIVSIPNQNYQQNNIPPQSNQPGPPPIRPNMIPPGGGGGPPPVPPAGAVVPPPVPVAAKGMFILKIYIIYNKFVCLFIKLF